MTIGLASAWRRFSACLLHVHLANACCANGFLRCMGGCDAWAMHGRQAAVLGGPGQPLVPFVT